MCEIMEQAIAVEVAEAIAEAAAARQSERIAHVQRMLSRKEPLDNIAFYTGFSLEEIEAIRILDAVNVFGIGVKPDGTAYFSTDVDFSCIENFRSVKPNLKFLLMLGGCEHCSDAFVRKSGRELCADSLMELLLKYDLYGLDNDWEVPTMTLGKVKGCPEDKLTYTMLMRTIRQRMDAEEARTGRHYLLTCAQSANRFIEDTIEVPKVAEVYHIQNQNTCPQEDVAVAVGVQLAAESNFIDLTVQFIVAQPSGTVDVPSTAALSKGGGVNSPVAWGLFLTCQRDDHHNEGQNTYCSRDDQRCIFLFHRIHSSHLYPPGFDGHKSEVKARQGVPRLDRM